jgi:hypothetical protein
VGASVQYSSAFHTFRAILTFSREAVADRRPNRERCRVGPDVDASGTKPINHEDAKVTKEDLKRRELRIGVSKTFAPLDPLHCSRF